MLKHKGTVTLESDRLVLRKFTMADAEAMFNTWTNDPEVAQYMRWNAHKDIDETKSVLENRMERYSSLSTYHWAIVLKDTDKLVGNIALICANENDMCGEVAYCIGRDYWGRGIIAEALKKVLYFGLLEVGFNRIEAYHAVNNAASGKVMEKAGMKYEGRMRQKYRSRLGFEDSNMYAILREDLAGEV